ncbi:TPA: hypothetical protein SMW47_000836 [Pseudomonas aeruginosa]|nr:hypothetical protein [Pseudomonas aeruginosa]
MNKANECTCPSGDGSLVHPCPAHPAVEQAGGDRWDALQSIMEWTAAKNIPDDRKLCLIRNAARAALAQPSPKCATCNDSGQIVVSGPHYQGEFQPPEYETEPCDMCAQPSPAQAEQAEAERPEVVARVDGTDEDWFIQPEDETELHNEGLLFAGCELGRMIDFDRIVGALRYKAELYDEVWALVTGKGYMNVTTAISVLESERDAALARVEQQERTIAGMNEAHATLAGLYEAAQAQHSVPDVSGFRRNRSALTDAQMRRLYDSSTETENERLGFAAFARLMRRAEAVHQIAAAPGKEVGHE